MNLTAFFSQTVQNPFWRWFLFVPVLLIVLDLATGITAAILDRKFHGEQVGAFLGKNVGWLAGASLLVVIGYWGFGGSAVATAIANVLGMGTLATSVAASIKNNVVEIIKRDPGLVPQPMEQFIDTSIQNPPPPPITAYTARPSLMSLPASNPGLPTSSLGVRAQMEQSSVFPAVTFPKHL